MGNDVSINRSLEEYSNHLKSRLDQILLSVSEKAQIDSGEETTSTLERLSAHLANCKVYIETIDYQQVNNPSFMRVHLDTLSRSVESLYRLSSMLDSQAESSPVLTLIERICTDEARRLRQEIVEYQIPTTASTWEEAVPGFFPES